MVDPIDGTNAFLRHIPEWTISAALVRKASRCSAPCSIRRPESSSTPCAGEGAFLNGRPIHVTDGELEGALIIASGGLFKKRIWKEPWPEVESRWVNSVAYRLALVAAGQRRRHGVALGQERVGFRRRRADGRGGRRHGDRPSRRCPSLQSPIPRFPSLVAPPPAPRQAHRAHEPRRPLSQAFGKVALKAVQLIDHGGNRDRG